MGRLAATLCWGGESCDGWHQRRQDWLKPSENQWLCYARAFDPELASLVSSTQHRLKLGNYEGECPSILLQGDPLDHIAAVDALRPDHQVDLAAFMAKQAAGATGEGEVLR